MRSLVVAIRVLLVLLVVAAAPRPAFATDYADGAALDELFAQLKIAHSAGEAGDIVAQIWDLWFNPAVPELAARMQDASAAMSNGNLPRALTLLSAIVKDYPDYSEGWNQRATLYYMLGDYAASLADIGKTLELEPRHFGALSGRVVIELKQGNRSAALKDMIAALAIDPYLETRSLFPELAPNSTNV
jgi:tetratricopeptide (TPR) repeat protein